MKQQITKGILPIATLVSVGIAQPSAAQYSPQQQWKGKIGKTIDESAPYKVEYAKKAPKGAPNVVLVVLDDVGFGASSAFGGLIETPTIDYLANNGLRYTNFHTTAISAPSRAALLTGRNHHSVHFGSFAETASDFPGYDAHLPFEKGTIAEILRENGYNTYAIGKWHLTPVPEVTQSGPFNRWPLGRGFDHFFGFHYALSDQYTPQLWEDNSKVEPDTKGKHLTTLLADKAIHYIASQKSTTPDKPFFLLFATGATHAPVQVDRSWIDQYKGKFDDGWDRYREKTLGNQKKLGIAPPNAELTPREPDVVPWDSLNAKEKKVAARSMEGYAGFLSHADYEIGRIVDFLRSINQLDNTIFLVIVGDNGAAKEGGKIGAINGYISSLKGDEQVDAMLSEYDNIATQNSMGNYPTGWSQATNTPFRLWKNNAHSEGGTRNPLVIYWPAGIKDKNGLRTQYGHLNDILPTIVELTGSRIPPAINGYAQEPIEGTSLAYSMHDPTAPSRHTQQYYEMFGKRAMYKDGWKAAAAHERGTDFEKDVWELFNMNDDFNERFNVADQYPEKLKELLDAFDADARKYNVYPLDGGSTWGGQSKSVYANASRITLYPGVDHIFGGAGPSFNSSRSFSIISDAVITDKSNEGVLFAIGGRFGGMSIFVKDGKLQVAHNSSTRVRYLESSKQLPLGQVTMRYEVRYSKEAKGFKDPAGTEAIYVNNDKVAEHPISRAESNISAYQDGVDVGCDQLSPVADTYKSPFSFTGDLKKVIIEYRENK